LATKRWVRRTAIASQRLRGCGALQADLAAREFL
jgi:hypothetical protein